MIPLQSGKETGFRAHDALVFGDQLLLEVQQLLPLPASVDFFFSEPDFRFLSPLSQRQQETVLANRKDTIPVVRDGMLIVPLVGEKQVQADLVVHDVDPALLQKMAADWLLELQGSLLQRFARVRQRYTDPFTGLYNQRALDVLLAGRSCWKSLFLIATVSRQRMIATGCQKMLQLASLLDVVTSEPLFYFGQGIFGHVSLHGDRRSALDFSHRLITRLKRESLRRVHIGFSCLSDKLSSGQILDDCWRALLEAERRGPFSLCDAASLHNRDSHPLALPPRHRVRKLQRKWQGCARFGLLVVSAAGEKEALVSDLTSLLPKECFRVVLSEDQQCVICPDYSARRTASLVEQLAADIEKRRGSCPTMGFCHWPTSGSGRLDSVRNCRKAILHGSFYGPGAVVAFDSLSLNVSGDLYFDEGDYKQAIKEYQAGLQMNPGDTNLLNSLGVALAEVNRHREAMACFSGVLQQNPENHMALVNKGMSSRQLGRNREAVQCFEKALQCSDHEEHASLEFYLQLARLYCILEKYDQAVFLLNQWRALKGEPEEFMFFRILGEACMGIGRHNDAVKALQRCLQIYPGNADSMSMLGLLYVLEDEGEDVGLSLCQRAINMDQTEAGHLHRYGEALYHLGRFKEALSAVRSALQRKRNHDRSVLLRGRIYASLGVTYRAKQSYKRVITMKSASDGLKEMARMQLNTITTAS